MTAPLHIESVLEVVFLILFYLRVCLKHKVHITLVERTQGHRNIYTQRLTGCA